MSKIFITQKDGFSGERIHAENWEEAEKISQDRGVDLVGILRDEHIYYED